MSMFDGISPMTPEEHEAMKRTMERTANLSEGGRPMTATERLREMLDERGVEHVDLLDKTTYKPSENATCTATRRLGDALEVSMRIYGATPEQAIEATLGPSDPREHGLVPHFWTGDETLHIDLGKLPERIDVTLPDPRGRDVYSARVHRFEPERGECKLEEVDTACDTASGYMLTREWCLDAVYKCSCGCIFGLVAHDRPRYCPNCGARVMD